MRNKLSKLSILVISILVTSNLISFSLLASTYEPTFTDEIFVGAIEEWEITDCGSDNYELPFGINDLLTLEINAIPETVEFYDNQDWITYNGDFEISVNGSILTSKGLQMIPPLVYPIKLGSEAFFDELYDVLKNQIEDTNNEGDTYEYRYYFDTGFNEDDENIFYICEYYTNWVDNDEHVILNIEMGYDVVTGYLLYYYVYSYEHDYAENIEDAQYYDFSIERKDSNKYLDINGFEFSSNIVQDATFAWNVTNAYIDYELPPDTDPDETPELSIPYEVSDLIEMKILTTPSTDNPYINMADFADFTLNGVFDPYTTHMMTDGSYMFWYGSPALQPISVTLVNETTLNWFDVLNMTYSNRGIISNKENSTIFVEYTENIFAVTTNTTYSNHTLNHAEEYIKSEYFAYNVNKGVLVSKRFLLEGYLNDSTGDYFVNVHLEINLIDDQQQDISINFITHSPAQPANKDSVTISATVNADAGINTVKVYYRVDNGSWLTEFMTADGATYSKNIGQFQTGETIDYYIHVTDNANNIAISTTYSFKISVSSDIDNGEITATNFGGFYAFLTVALCVALLKKTKRK